MFLHQNLMRAMFRLPVYFLLAMAWGVGRTESGSAKLTEAIQHAYQYKPTPLGEKLVTNAENEPAPGVGVRPGQESSLIPRDGSFSSFLQARNWQLAAARRARENPPSEGGGSGAGRTADDPSKPSPQPVLADTDPEVMILPKLEITARKVTTLGTQLADLDSRIRSEEKASEATWLDSLLNPSFLFGDTAKARAASAKRRNEVMNWQKILLISLETAATPEEKARIKDDIRTLSDMMRYWE